MFAAVAIAVQANLPVLWWGNPGVGKTNMLRQLARALGVPIEVLIASIHEPSDFGGLPVPDLSTKTLWLAAPGWAVRINAEAVKHKGLGGILVFDEISTAPPAVQAALLRPVHEGVVGDTVLCPNIARVAAANPAEVAAGGWELALSLANRFVHIYFQTDSKSWCDGMVSGSWEAPAFPKLPEGWQKHKPKQNALIASFIKARPSLLEKLPGTEETGKAFPSPRTWEMTATLLAACASVGQEESALALTLAAGSVGTAAAGEHFTWRKALDLPDPEELLKNPKKLKLPERPDMAYCILTSVVAAVLSDLTPERWNSAWDVLAKSVDQNVPDIGAAAARSLAQSYLNMRGSKKEYGFPASAASFGPLLQAAGIAK